MLDVRISAREVLRLNEDLRNNYHALSKLKLGMQAVGVGSDPILANENANICSIDDRLESQTLLATVERRLASSVHQQAIALVNLKRATGELLYSDLSCQTSMPTQNICQTQVPIVRRVSSDDATPNDVEFVPRLSGVVETIADDVPAQFNIDLEEGRPEAPVSNSPSTNP